MSNFTIETLVMNLDRELLNCEERLARATEMVDAENANIKQIQETLKRIAKLEELIEKGVIQ